jgi:hypothetical protein
VAILRRMFTKFRSRFPHVLLLASCGACVAVACADEVAQTEPDASQEAASPTHSVDATTGLSTEAGATPPTEGGAATKVDAANNNNLPDADASNDGLGDVADSGSEGEASSNVDCTNDFTVTCAQGAPCQCSPLGCSMSQGTGASSCDLVCTCNSNEVFECSSDCPPDAAPPANCSQGVACTPGVMCNGDASTCLCDNTGHLDCAATQ